MGPDTETTIGDGCGVGDYEARQGGADIVKAVCALVRHVRNSMRLADCDSLD